MFNSVFNCFLLALFHSHLWFSVSAREYTVKVRQVQSDWTDIYRDQQKGCEIEGEREKQGKRAWTKEGFFFVLKETAFPLKKLLSLLWVRQIRHIQIRTTQIDTLSLCFCTRRETEVVAQINTYPLGLRHKHRQAHTRACMDTRKVADRKIRQPRFYSCSYKVHTVACSTTGTYYFIIRL